MSLYSEPRLKVEVEQEESKEEEKAEKIKQLRSNAEGNAPQKQKTVKRSVPKVGRNDQCPCGSGLKYKKCHGKDQN